MSSPAELMELAGVSDSYAELNRVRLRLVGLLQRNDGQVPEHPDREA